MSKTDQGVQYRTKQGVLKDLETELKRIESDTGRDGKDGADGVDGKDGKNGVDGISAGFGTPTIAVTTLDTGEAATASITASGPNTAKIFSFQFGIPKGDSGESSGGGQGFDRVIKTQAEFNSLIADSTWLGAISVAFIGSFTLSSINNSGIKIPQTVKQIQGFNNATITVTAFANNVNTAKAALWYDTLPPTLDYSIRDLTVICRSEGQTANAAAKAYSTAFFNCANLINCIGESNGGSSWGTGFNNCLNLTNCKGTGEALVGDLSGNSDGYAYGFYRCNKLTNCEGYGRGSLLYGRGDGFMDCADLSSCYGYGFGQTAQGFTACQRLTNCRGQGDGDVVSSTSGSAFTACQRLTNCEGYGRGGMEGFAFNECIQLVNCEGYGVFTASGIGYTFYSCSYLSNCKRSNNASSTGFLGGTTKLADNITVAEAAT